MTFADIFGQGGGQLLLILALFLIFTIAKNLPELFSRLARGIEEFKKAMRELTNEVRNQDSEKGEEPVHPLVVVATITLGAVCLFLAVHGFTK